MAGLRHGVERPLALTALEEIPHRRGALASYSGMHHSRPVVYRPRTLDELARLFASARLAGKRVTLRGGGNSFDDQALNRDLVISMEAFRGLSLQPQAREVTVGPGTTWGEIVRALEPHGLVPYVAVTTRRATAGGTLSGGCLSRFSPSHGKEGMHIKRFVLLTPRGELLTCTPPSSPDPDTWSLGERAYCGAIGGLGYLGAVVEITYALLHVGQTRERIGVRTEVHKLHGLTELPQLLVPANPERSEAVYAALLTGTRRPRALLFRSEYTPAAERRRMLLHRPELVVRPPVEWLMRVRRLNRLLWRVFFDLYRDGDQFVDDLLGYTFFMDGNVRAKQLAAALGFSPRTLQQTFVLPASGVEAADRMLAFLSEAEKVFDRASLRPTLTDALFLPKDPHSFLSPVADQPGYAVSFAFETSRPRRIERIRQCYAALSERCLAAGGRVYLVKNVTAPPQVLARMYERSLPRFFALKAEVDPGGVLRNEFLERNFGSFLA